MADQKIAQIVASLSPRMRYALRMCFAGGVGTGKVEMWGLLPSCYALQRRGLIEWHEGVLYSMTRLGYAVYEVIRRG